MVCWMTLVYIQRCGSFSLFEHLCCQLSNSPGDVKCHGGLNGDSTSHVWFACHGLCSVEKRGPASSVLHCPKFIKGMCPKFIRGNTRLLQKTLSESAIDTMTRRSSGTVPLESAPPGLGRLRLPAFPWQFKFPPATVGLSRIHSHG